jgi:hypothetical protein
VLTDAPRSAHRAPLARMTSNDRNWRSEFEPRKTRCLAVDCKIACLRPADRYLACAIVLDFARAGTARRAARPTLITRATFAS